MNATRILTQLGVLVPELKPLQSDILAALATARSVELIMQPVTQRLLANEPAFLELLGVAPQLNVLSPAIARALATLDKVRKIVARREESLHLDFDTKGNIKMDWNTLNGVLRAIVPAGLAYAVGKGWITQGSVGDISAALLAVAAAGWSVVTNKPTSAA